MKTYAHAGCTIEKRIIGYAYPRNGNLHNPTPRVEWQVFDAEGVSKGRAATLREAKLIAEETD